LLCKFLAVTRKTKLTLSIALNPKSKLTLEHGTNPTNRNTNAHFNMLKCALQTPTTRRDASYNLSVERDGANNYCHASLE